MHRNENELNLYEAHVGCPIDLGHLQRPIVAK